MKSPAHRDGDANGNDDEDDGGVVIDYYYAAAENYYYLPSGDEDDDDELDGDDGLKGQGKIHQNCLTCH